MKTEDLRDITIETQLAPWSYGIELYIGALDMTRSKRYVVRDLEFSALEEGPTLAPLFTLTMNASQHLMDGLWSCGLRPTEGTGSAGALKATQDHLEDMRKLTFEFVEKVTL